VSGRQSASRALADQGAVDNSQNKPQKRGPTSPRRRAREFVVQGLYQHLVGAQDLAAIIVQAESAGGFDKIDRALYDGLLEGTLQQLPALRALIEPHLSRPWAEVSPIERSVLLMAACELRDQPETPWRVVVNEAIEITKSYGGTDGFKFVNGVLDKIGPQLRPIEQNTKASR